MEILIVYLVICVLIGVWADSRGRSGGLFGVFAFLFSPIIAGIVLLIMPNKIEQEKETRAKELAEQRKHEERLAEIKVLMGKS